MNEKHETGKVSRRYFVTACSALAGGVALERVGLREPGATGIGRHQTWSLSAG